MLHLFLTCYYKSNISFNYIPTSEGLSYDTALIQDRQNNDYSQLTILQCLRSDLTIKLSFGFNSFSMSDFRCNEYSAPMDSYKHHIPKADSYLYSSDELQPGLEVGNAPSRQPCPWPRQEIDGVERKQTAIPERKQIAGLAIGTFWALVVSLSVIVAGVIGGGVGAGLAAQKNKCKR